MSSTQLTLIILTPITIALIIFAALIYFGLKNKTLKEKELEKLSNTIKLERLKKIDAIISRVGVVVKGNKNYDSIFIDLKNKYDDIEVLVKKLSVEFENITIDAPKIKKKLFLENVKNIESMIEEVDKLESEFFSSSSVITQQDAFLSKEHVFFSSHLRKGIAVYRLKKIVLSKLSTKIDELLNEIKSEGKKYSMYSEMAKNNEASSHLKKYSEKVTQFVKIISEAPNIETYIYTTIPRVITNLTNIYKVKRAELSVSMINIKFKESLLTISRVYEKLKNEYLDLDFENAKINIIKILRSVKNLESTINFEIVSKNYFIDNFQIVISESSRNIRFYKSLKKQVGDLIAKGEVVPASLRNLVKETGEIAIYINNETIKLRNIVEDKNVPYSSKLNIMKLLLNKLNIFVSKNNEIINLIWSMNMETSMIKNKFKKSETALNEILANMKTHNVKLVKNQEQEYEYLYEIVNSVAEKIKNQAYDKELKNKVEELMKLTSKFYTAVNGNIQIAEIASNLIKEFAPLRATDTRLNIVLNNSERTYLEGKYAHSLNIIIRELERRGN